MDALRCGVDSDYDGIISWGSVWTVREAVHYQLVYTADH